MGCQLPKFLNLSPIFMGLLSEPSRSSKDKAREHIKKYVPSALSIIYCRWKRTLTVEICRWGAGVAGSGIQGVRVAALPLRVPAWAGRGEGGGRGVAWVLIHLLKLPLEKPTHGVSVNNLQGGAEAGIISKLFTLISTPLITKELRFCFANIFCLTTVACCMEAIHTSFSQDYWYKRVLCLAMWDCMEPISCCSQLREGVSHGTGSNQSGLFAQVNNYRTLHPLPNPISSANALIRERTEQGGDQIIYA